MSNDINLLYTKRQGRFAAFTTKVKLLRIAALAVLSIVTITSVGIFLLVLSSPLPALKKEENELLTSLSASHAKIVKQTLIAQRLQEASQLISRRPQFDATIETFKKELPPEVTMKSITVDQKVVTLLIQSDDLSAIDAYVTKLSTLVSQVKGIKTIVMNTLTYQPGQATEANVTITLL